MLFASKIICGEISKTSEQDSMDTDDDINMSTNLCLTDKDGFFTSILTSLTHSVTLQSSHLTDLVLICTGPDGPLPVSVHSVVLSSQSPLLRNLLLSVTEPVLVLPEVELKTVWHMLDLLYTGRCGVTKQKDSFRLVHLLTSLGLDTVVNTLEMERLSVEHSPQECPEHCMLERMSSSGSVKYRLTPHSPELECKECGQKFYVKQAVEFFFHERDCNIKSSKRFSMLRNAEKINCKDAQSQTSVTVSSASDSSNSPSHFHHGNSSGQAMECYEEFLKSQAAATSEEPLKYCQVEYTSDMNQTSSSQKAKKISKTCYICGTLIAGAGRGWKFPLYSHFSRRHFAEELVREFRTPDNKCSVCGKEEESRSQFVAHLGAKHRLVEKYLDMKKLQEQENVNDSPPSVVIKGDYSKLAKTGKQFKPRRLQLEVTELAKELLDQEAGHENFDPEAKKTKPRRNRQSLGRSKPKANISCPFCEKKVVIRPVLQSHLLSKHFKKDCEEAIKQIFERTGGVCPMCPGFRFNKPGTLDWTVFIHFSRKHKIAEDLDYSDNLLNQDNVEKIVQRFCPQ